MAPSPRSVAATAASLAARFAFKPPQSINASTSTSPARRGAAGMASASPETGTKRRLSTISKINGTETMMNSSLASPRRTSPRKHDEQQSNDALKQDLASDAGSARSSTTSNIHTRSPAKNKTIGNELEEDWEIPDDELLAATEDLLSSSSPATKKVKLSQSSIKTSSKSTPTSSQVKGPAKTSSTSSSIKGVSKTNGVTQTISDGMVDIANTGKEDGPSNISTTTSIDTTRMPNEIAQLFFESLSDNLKPGKGGNLSHRHLLELECLTMHPSWLSVLKSEMKKSYFLDLKRFLWTEGVKNSPEISKNIFPPAREIYSWSRFTPLDKVRVVILGQDPYHNDGQAHGLAFSVRSNVAVPPSLKNIYKEIKNDYPDFQIPKHGYLGSWARQGVLMLNTSLSVRAHQANSHSKKGWEEFTDAILRQITARSAASAASSADNRGVVFFAWGSPAQKRTAFIDRSKHLVLSSVHPSPLSANRGFFGNQHFKKANEWLKKTYGEDGVIDWCNLDPDESK